jgi:hypothetical protein
MKVSPFIDKWGRFDTLGSVVDRKKLAAAFRVQGWVLTAAQLAGLGVYPRRQQELLAAGWMERTAWCWRSGWRRGVWCAWFPLWCFTG